MSFTLFLVGNGLGRAIDNDYFALHEGIRRVWESGDEVVVENHQPILRCLNRENSQLGQPQEEEFEPIYLATKACSALSKIESGENLWLTDLGRDFPKSINYVLGKFGSSFHCDLREIKNQKFHNFISRFTQYISDNSCHVATLNYDNLLYQSFFENGILNGFRNGSRLLDGFTANGISEGPLIFDDQWLERKERNLTMGFYIHLHGSPLFIDGEVCIQKLRQSELVESFNNENLRFNKRHLVLAPTRMKPDLIIESPLLDRYWTLFDQALRQTNRVVLLGYGGFDIHVNETLKRWSMTGTKDVDVTVVTRRDSSRGLNFWASKCFGTTEPNTSKLTLKTYESILDFDFDFSEQ